MDVFTRLNRRDIQNRQVDTLIGLCKGITADKIVNQAEAEFLLTWLIQSQQASDNPIIANLLEKVSAMLEDGVLDADESKELLSVLGKITGNTSVVGELAKTSTLPLNDPMPSITFRDRSFLFTGTCAFGTRKQCHDATESLGGRCVGGVSKSLDFLVLGIYVTDSWAHENFGRKIEKAVEYRNNGIPIAIITEEHWLNEGGLA
ncbi:MAG: BRCT domain-containing protein [Gammaproteobacteria bacterium]